jgi:hypothetical protein
MNNDDIVYNENGEPIKVYDTYRRHNPDVKNIGKLCWFTIGKEFHIGKAVSTMPLGYEMEFYSKDTGIIIRRIINSQAVIFPE